MPAHKNYAHTERARKWEREGEKEGEREKGEGCDTLSFSLVYAATEIAFFARLPASQPFASGSAIFAASFGSPFMSLAQTVTDSSR